MSKGNLISRFRVVLTVSVLMLLAAVVSYPQYMKSSLEPPPPPPAPGQYLDRTHIPDSDFLPSPVSPTLPRGYSDYIGQEYAADLRTPSNIKTEAVFDPVSGLYVIHTKVGDRDVVTPYMMTADEYNSMINRREMFSYFQSRNAESFEQKDKQPFNVLDMNFALGPLEKIFGPGGVRLTTQGSIQLSMGIKSNRTDNPALSLRSRRKTFFDFDQKIQATIAASVGDKMKFNMTYNTDATFDFDSKNLKLVYEGKEDEIIKNIEAGNVSMSTGSSLIRGGTALFGVKAKLQFGKLTLTGLISQQNSESKTVNTQGGVQATKFSIRANDYDANRHFFLAQYFYDNYDQFASRLPHVSSGINITRIEVWVTNKNSNYQESRNFVGFMDLGENTRLANDYWRPDMAINIPSNQSNNLLSVVKTDYPGARNINQVTQALEPLRAYGIEGGKDYEKVESARLLKSSEYTLNSTLGYISLKSALNSDEVLAVAYEYTYNGKVYQVGEFSSDVTNTSESLYLKMLRGTTISPRLPMWKLMMKNVYSLGAYQLSSNKFKLNIKYLSDTTGIEINYLPVPGISNIPLLQVMNLDRIDSNQESNPDGFFDYIEGYTVQSSSGKIIFPVAEPFGAYLEKKIGNKDLAAPYVFNELYDSTLVVAKQFADKDKYSLVGEYQASSGATIRLNAMNVPRGSVVVMAGGVVLTENSDYTVDYSMGIVTITNQSIIDSGTNVSVTLENQSMFSMQRKTLLGLDAQYRFNKNFTLGGTILHFSEKGLTEKVNIGDEVINNTMWGLNLNYNTEFMWLTNLLNKVPTISAVAPSTFKLNAEFAQLVPHQQKSGSNKGSSYIDDFESTQTGVDLRNPYSWFLASTPYDGGADPLFPEASLSNNVAYGKNRALLAWNYIDRIFTQRNSSMLPGYLKNDLKQLSNPYVREVTVSELFPNRQLNYGEQNLIQTFNLSFYPKERGPYNLDATNIDGEGNLLYPEKRWGGIMRKMDNTNFENSNVEYIQFWLMDPFLDPENQNREGGDLYFNFGEMSEDILKDGMKSYENGIPIDGNNQYMTETVWGRVSRQNSLTYAFENASDARPLQDVGLDGLPNDDEFNFSSYKEYLDALRAKLTPAAMDQMQEDPFSALNDPAGDNYHFYRSNWYDEHRTSILDRYKHYNGVEGNSLSPDQSPNPQYQSARNVPDVEDINQDNTLNEYERYFQYKVSIRPEDLEVGKNYITDKQVSPVPTRDGSDQTVTWYQFKIPLANPDKVVGGISDFSTIRFARIFMTGFKETTHLRFATLELVRGEWRPYGFNLNSRNDSPAEGQLDVSVVNIEENAGRTPVNYVLPPGVDRIQDPGQAQATQLNEQALSLKVTDLQAGDARGIYKNTQLDLRIYKRIQMWIHAEALIGDMTNLHNGDLALFVRLGSDVKNNYYEYEIPLDLTPEGNYNNLNSADRAIVWPYANRLDLDLSAFTDIKTERNRERSAQVQGVGYNLLFSRRDPANEHNTVSVLGNPSLSDVRVMLIGVRNKSNSTKAGTVWVNEMKVTDFNESGGWAVNANANLGISDIAMVNFSYHRETDGFGGVDQGLASRRLEDYQQYNIAVQGDVGKLVPKKLKLSAPIYYSKSSETTTPKYNPLDQDILLKDALDAAATEHERDSIRGYAVTKKNTESFSISNFKFDITSKIPMPWDPSNFTLAFSFNKQRNEDPTTLYEVTNDYRGSFQYSYSPIITPLKPFAWIKGKGKTAKFFKDWQINWLFSNLTFFTNMTRYYYEQQTRSEVDVDFQLPVQVSKNFYWNRQLTLTWNPIQSLNLSFSSNTTARIEETIGAVNKRLFPDKYRDWKDTVLASIRGLGTPWNYNQTFTGTYRAPFNKIGFLDYLTGNLTYTSTYRWDKGATVDDLYLGNTIQNQSSWNADARLNFETLFNKSKYLQGINKRFASSSNKSNRQSGGAPKKPTIKKFERAYTLSMDTTTMIEHNLKTKKVKFKATINGRAVSLKTRIVDENKIEVLTKGKSNIKVTVTEDKKERSSNFAKDFAEYSLRFLMMPRSFSFRWRSTHSLNLPQFTPNVGDIFGQSNNYGPMSPGLDFAFGFFNEDYVNKALERGWLLTDGQSTSPAVWNQGREFTFELNLEPIRGLKITLTSNLTDNRTQQVQFMYADMPTARSGSYTRTHVAIGTALKNSKADNGYASAAFDKFLQNIPIVAQRIEGEYAGLRYPRTGFLDGNPLGGTLYNPEVGGVSATSSDVLIPAFIAAYSGQDVSKITLRHFPGLSSMLPNWKVTYDGFQQMGFMKKVFKTFTISHAYQCTYSVGSYTSYLNWVGVDGDLGFTLNEQTQRPMPSSPFNISSVAITEKFAPLVGVKATLFNDMTFNAEYRDSRTLNLNSSAGQVVETTSKQITIGAGYKIANFSSIIKIGSRQGGVNNDLSLNLDLSFSNNQSLIRRIETAYTQATQGTQTFSLNFMASYQLSKRITLNAFFDHQINTPLVSNSSFPTSNSNYGISCNISLAR
ncbi:MAG: cell surface protein SprA [Clostridium sp.]|nr:cell surface protein SprA [Prevotella sp.]MCM1428691.1 cell surface protein SprA [Clostridium sp.]MCM1475066.1 cell surface protein SprA [Muribaculaceae bacterium]